MQKKLLLTFGLLCAASNSSASFVETMMADKMRIGSCVAGLATMLGINYGMKNTKYINTENRKSAAQISNAFAMLFAFNNAIGFKISPLQYAVDAGVAGVSFLASTDLAAQYASKIPVLGSLLTGSFVKNNVETEESSGFAPDTISTTGQKAKTFVCVERGYVGKIIRFVLTGGLIKTALNHFCGM